MAYVAVVKALYDYAAQDPETELALKEDDIVYVIEKEDDDWWKAKLKDADGDEGAIGLIPASYVEELPPLNQTRALYAYDSTSPEELSMGEESVLHVFALEEDWLLVRVDGGEQRLGFVPRSYCEPLDESTAVAIPDAQEAEAEIEEHRREEEEAEEKRQVAERQRLLKLKDKVETWTISEMEGKKKKKGTLGVGNGAVFFASDSDKMGGVKQYNITELVHVAQPSSKTIALSFSSLSEELVFHCGGSDTTRAILAKLETSKEAAGEVLELTRSDSRHVMSDVESVEHDEYDEAVSPPSNEPKTVRWAPDTSAAAPVGEAETATVLYDFDAQGDDELSVQENEVVDVVDKENDEWWTVRNASGREGVVPAQYVQLNDASGTAAPVDTYNEEDEHRREQEEAAAAASLEAERQRAAAHKAEERRAIERAARERQKQEEEDRQFAEQVEAKEAAKAERRARRQQEEQRSQREYEIAKRREAARGLEPPKISKRPSAQDVSEVARSLPTKGKSTPARPPENSRPKPTAGRTRVWSDKSGQFKVEAEYLGLNGNKIRLHKMNGVIIEVPLEKMSQEDTQLIRRHEARKARAAEEEDNAPLGQRRPGSSRSEETVRRAEPQFEAAPKEAMEPQKPRKPRYDWFAFFLDAGCGIDDCTRYAANFERDRIDEEIIPDLESSTLRNLGLKEGDVIRVRKVITSKYAEKTPEQIEQMKQDEDYARQLQEHENSGGKGPIPQPPPSLFTGKDGKLANNTRRGRPEKKSTGPESVDAAALAAASDQLSRVTVTIPPSPPRAPSPPPAKKEESPKSLIPGFDDDAWTIKPSASKPASPAPPPPAAAPTPPPANPTDSLLAQIQAMRPASTGITSNTTGGSSSFDKYAAFSQPQQQQQQQRTGPAPIQQTQTGGSGFGSGAPQQQQQQQSMGYGMGMQNTGQPMSAFQNQSRGPLAPVPSNEGLLNPLQPVRTGFVPTRQGGSPAQNGMMPQQTGFMPQQQQQQPMMMQPTGYANGFQAGYGGQPQQIQPNFTGYPGNFAQQSQASGFNAIANVQPAQPPSNPDKFAPSNIFAAMKQNDFGKPEDSRPQESNKYDSLRPLATGYNGAPGMMPQQTGMMQQPTGMGMYGNGMMPQMTGFNPQQMGYMGNQYGGQGYR